MDNQWHYSGTHNSPSHVIEAQTLSGETTCRALAARSELCALLCFGTATKAQGG